MIFDKISNLEKYSKLNPLIKDVAQFIENNDLKSLTSGKYEIIGSELFAVVVHGSLLPTVKFEAHKKYIDLHLTIQGEDTVAWKSILDCKPGEFDVSCDSYVFEDHPINWMKVPKDHFAIFFPQDAHAAMRGQGEIRKIIFKIKSV